MPGIVGPDRFDEVSAGALELTGVDGVEVLLFHEWGGLTRFAKSEIHQSTAREDTELRVRVVIGGRTGVASTNDLSPAGAALAARSAKEMAEVVAPDPLWPGLPPPAEVPTVDRFDDATASMSPDARAEQVARLIAACDPGFTAAGVFETQAVEIGFANSAGQRCWAPSTQASITAVATGGRGGAGFADGFAAVGTSLDAEDIGRQACAKAVASQDPGPIDPGTYPVVLEPTAAAGLLELLAWVGFGGRAYIEDRSCLSGKAGRQVASPVVTIWDDGTDPRTFGSPFDFEGVPRRKHELIRDGVFVGPVYDRRTALQAGLNDGSTGHALPPPNPEGPLPLQMFMDEGDATLEEMIAATDHGLLVTRFHYTNVVNPMESSITGMTRDGTFRIEGGEVVGPVVNLRFTQSILGALEATTLVGRRAELESEYWFAASHVPALKIEEFHFSSVSDH